eukprot:Skav221370  [mRNA]  locus=scaffold2286:183227:183981:- [translate_table: standard]
MDQEITGSWVEALQQKATSEEFIAAINAGEGSTWVAGENLRFAGATLGEAKILMGTLQDVSNGTRLPYKALDQAGRWQEMAAG